MPKSKSMIKSSAPKAAKPMSSEEARQAILTAAREGVEIVAKRSELLKDDTIGLVERSVLEDVINTALDINGADWPGIMSNSRFCIMAAWQLGRTNTKPDFLPGEAMATIIRSITSIPKEEQERNIKIAASLAATANAKTLEPQARVSCARVHVWVAYLYGRDRAAMERGLS